MLIDLSTSIEFSDENVVSKLLVNNADIDLVKIALQKNQSLNDHQSDCAIVLQCLDGAIEVRVDETISLITKDSLLYLEKDSIHNINALEDSILLIILVK